MFAPDCVITRATQPHNITNGVTIEASGTLAVIFFTETILSISHHCPDGYSEGLIFSA